MPSPKRSRKGLATSTVARYANWVNTIFLAALDEGIVARNPANSKHSGRPRGETAKRVKPFVIWNVEQLTSFCDWALADDETLPTGERYVIGSVKGGRPRTVSFDRTCTSILDDWREVLPGLLAAGGDNVTPLFGLRAHDPLFPSLPGRAATQSGLHAAFLRAQQHYRDAHRDRDLPRLTVHELRHTHASLLFEAGQSVKVVQERLGHASAQVTLNTYAHLLHDAQSRAAAALDDLLAAGQPDRTREVSSD